MLLLLPAEPELWHHWYASEASHIVSALEEAPVEAVAAAFQDTYEAMAP